ncbi:MAG: hypothetical protein AB7P13_06495 [Candidatus Nitrosocosmicus sp.]
MLFAKYNPGAIHWLDVVGNFENDLGKISGSIPFPLSLLILRLAS